MGHTCMIAIVGFILLLFPNHLVNGGTSHAATIGTEASLSYLRPSALACNKLALG